MNAPLGANPLIRWLRHEQLNAHSERVLAKIALETGGDAPTSPTAKLPGDTRALRGIPMVGARGVGATMAGTQPERETLERERRRLKLHERTADR